MDEKKKKTLQSVYKTACDNYLEAFAEKHGFDPSDCEWVANQPGGVAMVGDYYVDMQTILTDIDKDAPEEAWLGWYDYQLEVQMLELPKQCNFRSWIHGCPRYSEETLARFRALHNEVERAKRRLMEAVEQEKKKPF